jgi:hypothetical protein
VESISKKYSEILQENAKIKNASVYFSGAYKDHREWHMLGAAEAIHRHAGSAFPWGATKRERPDFDLFDAASNFQYGLETTTVHPDGRKVHQHHRNWEREGSKPRIHDDPRYDKHWEWLRASIRKKAKDPYMAGSVLLIYFNVSLHDTIEAYQDDFGTCIRAEWNRDPKGCFGVDPVAMANVRGIHVLSADMKSLAVIYPSILTIGNP